MRFIFFIFLFLLSCLYAETSYKFENVNLTTHFNDSYNNYDRARATIDFKNEKIFSLVITDIIYNSSSYSTLELKSDAPFKTQTPRVELNNGYLYGQLYRAYLGYEDENNRYILGLQNITMGVGRIWTPTNLFNPKNIYAIENSEVYGLFALSYTRYIGDMSNILVVVSQNEQKSFQYALRYKSFVDIGDIAIDIISSDETKMFGFEYEANFGESGIEIRSEFAYIKNLMSITPIEKKEKEFMQLVVGADYGFVNGITLVTEALYSSKTFSQNELYLNYNSNIALNMVDKNFYGAVSLSYGFNIFLDGSITYIDSFEENYFIAPTLSYTLNDFNLFTIGMQYSETQENLYYFKYTLSF